MYGSQWTVKGNGNHTSFNYDTEPVVDFFANAEDDKRWCGFHGTYETEVRDCYGEHKRAQNTDFRALGREIRANIDRLQNNS